MLKDLGSRLMGSRISTVTFRTEIIDRRGPSLSLRLCHHQSKVKGSPQYTIDVRDWKTGDEVASDGFSLAIPEGAKELKPGDVPDFDELPALFTKKGAQ